MKYLFFFLLIGQSVFSQTNMGEGFSLLEQGQFHKAVQFFEPIVEAESDNLTAQICYARAKGLAGDVFFAIEHFKKLQNEYPQNSELKVNLAESYLWAKQPKAAKRKYVELKKLDPLSFAVNLGLANSLYQLAEFEAAMKQIKEAINISPDNIEALKSKKYISLAYADQLAKLQNFTGALEILNEILTEHRDDKEILLLLSIVYLQQGTPQKSVEILEFLIERRIDDFESHILISHCYMLDHKYKKALASANVAIANCAECTSENFVRAGIQKVNVLGAYKKFKKAHALIDSLQHSFGLNPSLQLARARILVWSKKIKNGILKYKEIEGLEFEVQMGLAEAYNAIHEKTKAMQMVTRALELKENNTDALKFKSILDSKQRTGLQIDGHQSNDIAENQAKELFALYQIPIGDRHIVSIGAGYRKTQNLSFAANAEQYTASVSDIYRVTRRISLSAGMRYLNHSTELKNTAYSFLPHVSLDYALSPKHSLSFSYKRNGMSYSSELINSGIMNNQLALNYSFNQARLPGIYAAYSKDMISDGNSKRGFFGSVYYELSTFPLLKLGVNAHKIQYEFERNELYFSPQNYRAAEGFVHFGNVYNQNAKFTYEFNGAIGVQKIDEGQIENISRIDVQLGLRCNNKAHIIGQYLRNTAANSTTVGYNFERFSLRLKYSL